jgi:hypothetical protein
MESVILATTHLCWSCIILLAGVQSDQRVHVMRKAVYNSVILKLKYVFIFRTNTMSVEI